MRLHRYDSYNLIKESQSKKIREYIDFSTFLDWYNTHRAKIADILGVSAEKLASEEDILKQSHGLINNIINPQDRGVDDRSGEVGTIAGFESFNTLKNNLIHDILHNIYNVSKKNFDDYVELDFDESENIEEIEVLALEESFMKYLKMDYVKSDFVHQNINRLVSFLLMTIIRNDPERIVSILDGEVEPYVKVYDEQYPIKGTPFENLYEIFKHVPIDPVRDNHKKIKNGQDFKDWLGYMVLYGEAIDYEDSADRASFPRSNFLGDKSFDELTTDEMKDFINGEHYVYDAEDGLPGADTTDYSVEGFVASEYDNLPTDLNDLFVLGEPLKKSSLPKQAQETLLNRETEYRHYPLKVENIYKVEMDEDTDYHNTFDPDTKWIVTMTRGDGYGDVILSFNKGGGLLDDKKGGIWDDVNLDNVLIKYEDLRDFYWDRDAIPKEVEAEINYMGHTDDLDKNIKVLSDYNDNTVAITRRYLRYNDVLVNNTKIKSKDGNFSYIEDSLFDNYKSLSKNPLTDNAKKLVRVFDEFRGWSIKNFDMLKKRGKKMKKLFTQEDMDLLNKYVKWTEHLSKDIYDNVLLSDKSSQKSEMETTLYELLYSFGRDSRVRNTFRTYKRLKKIFSSIDSDQIFNYLKRSPNINVEDLKKDINRFNDMFFDEYEKNFDRYSEHFSSLQDISFIDIQTEITKEVEETIHKGKTLNGVYFITNFNISKEDTERFLDIIDRVFKKYTGGTLVREGFRLQYNSMDYLSHLIPKSDKADDKHNRNTINNISTMSHLPIKIPTPK